MTAPLGVFDSGLGGLSVVADILRRQPAEHIMYLGDTAHVPYGPRPVSEIQDFSSAIGRYLIHRRGARCFVIACNTATSAAAAVVRAELPVPVVGMEPAVKPAAQATRTGVIGVLATASTLSGERFHSLIEKFAEGVEVLNQPCPDLVAAVEAGAVDTHETREAIARYTAPLLARGVDTLVLGCTHFPILSRTITSVVGPEITLIETGPAVARRVEEVAGPAPQGLSSPPMELLTTGDLETFDRVARTILAVCGVERPVITRAVRWRDGELEEDAKS